MEPKLGVFADKKHRDRERGRGNKREREREGMRVTGILYWCVAMNPEDSQLTNRRVPRPAVVLLNYAFHTVS